MIGADQPYPEMPTAGWRWKQLNVMQTAGRGWKRLKPVKEQMSYLRELHLRNPLILCLVVNLPLCHRLQMKQLTTHIKHLL